MGGLGEVFKSCDMRLSSGERHPPAPSVVGAGKVGGTRATEGVAHPVISEQGKIQYGLEVVSLFSEVFSKLGLSRSCNQASQRSWNEFGTGPAYLWDSPATDPSPPWPASSGSPTPTATVSTQGLAIAVAALSLG